MLTTRWIVHCGMCGYLMQPEYPAQWGPDRWNAYRFHHKREALCAVTEYSRPVREFLVIEPLESESDGIFD